MASDSALVVVGYDGSPGGVAALREAVREARYRRARLRVVTAWRAPSYTYGSRAVPTAVSRLGEELRREVGAELERAVDELRRQEPDLEVESRLVEGTPAGVLTTEAVGADLLVVGSRGFGGFRELLLGSVSHQCAQHASCPVLIVPPAPAPPAS